MVGDNHGKLAGDVYQQYIRFCSDMVMVFSSGDAHVNFEVVDGTFYNNSDFIGGNPFPRVMVYAGEDVKIHVAVSISGSSLSKGVAKFLTTADIHCSCYVDFGQAHLSRSERSSSWQCLACFMSRL